MSNFADSFPLEKVMALEPLIVEADPNPGISDFASARQAMTQVELILDGMSADSVELVLAWLSCKYHNPELPDWAYKPDSPSFNSKSETKRLFETTPVPDDFPS